MEPSSMSETTTKTTTSKPSGPDAKRRKVIYPEVEIKKCVKEESLTVNQAREYLGFREAKKDEPYLLKGFNETGETIKITCDYNVRNRPFYPSVYETLKQVILNKQWRFNGEPIIIGKTGLLEDGQHTLMALIQAEYERQFGKGKHHWQDIWKNKPITIEKLVVFGVSEEEDVVNSINTAHPRDLADVLYRSEFFLTLPPDARNMVSRICKKAVQNLWVRLGRANDLFASRLCHSEAVEFIRRHPKILTAVKHIFEEDAEGSIGQIVPTGWAATLLYLMGASASDVDEYLNAEEPGDSAINFSRWEKAEEFWVMLGSKSDDTKVVRDYLAQLVSDENTASVMNRVAVLIKAWEHFVQGHQITRNDIKLKFVENEKTGVPTLDHHPSIGGIDLGTRKDQKAAQDDEPEMSPDQLEAAKAEQKRIRQEKAKASDEDRKAKAAKLAETLKKKREEAAAAVQGNGETNGQDMDSEAAAANGLTEAG
jgi:hypothetical protein